MKSFVTFIIGVIVGIVLIFGGVVGAGYFILSSKTLGDVEDILLSPGSDKLLEKEERETTLWTYSMSLFGAFGDLDSLTVEKFEEATGNHAFSNLLAGLLGVKYEDIKNVKVKDIFKESVNFVTLGGLKKSLGLELPNLPVFNNDEFMDKPIRTAFADFDNMTLDNFIQITYDEEAAADDTKMASSPMLQKMGGYLLSEISSDMDSIVNDMYLSDIITEPDEDSLINKFLHLKVGELSSETDGVIGSMLLREVMTIDENSTKVIRALADNTIVTQYEEDGVTVKTLGIDDQLKILKIKEIVDIGDALIWDTLGESTLETLGADVDGLKVRDVIDTTADDCNILLKRLADSEIRNIGSELSDEIKRTKLGELIEIDEENSEPILIALKDVYLDADALNTAIAEFTIADVFEDYNKGLLGLVPEDTLLSELPKTLADATTNTSLYKLREIGMYHPNLANASPEVKAHTLNQTPSEIIDGYIVAISGGPSVFLEVDFSGVLDNQILEGLAEFEEGITLNLVGDVTIADDVVFEHIFNIRCNGYDLVIGENVSIILADEGTGYMFIDGYSGAEYEFITETFFANAVKESPCVAVEFF